MSNSQRKNMANRFNLDVEKIIVNFYEKNLINFHFRSLISFDKMKMIIGQSLKYSIYF